MTAPVIITLDVETAPLEVYSWGLWKVNVGLDQIMTEWSLLAFAYKHLGRKEVSYQDNRSEPNPRNDFALMAELWHVLDEADIVITQNGRKFDMKRINARLAMQGFPPPSPVRVIDTLIEARRTFGFTSNKLEWLSAHLTCEKKTRHEKFPGFKLWQECLRSNPLAWKEMQKYNVQDVIATEALYLKLRPWIARHPNVATYAGRAIESCPKCGSDDLQYRGTTHTDKGVYRRMRCNACTGWSRTRQNLQDKEVRKVMLT